MNNEHAFLSASSAHKWLNCTSSPTLEARIPDTPNEYTQEGILAHEIAETILKYATKAISDEEYEKILNELKEHKSFYEGMLDEIKIYTDYCLSKTGKIYVEYPLDLSLYVPEGFGTADCVIVYDQKIEVVDLKFGKGVEISPTDNPQLMLYGLGALEAFDYIYDIEEVTMSVAQIRLHDIESYTMKAEKLRKWGEEVVKPKAQLAFEGKGETKAGEWCVFCKVRDRCKTRSEYLLESYEKYKEKEELKPEELAEILEKSKEIKTWLSDIEKYALDLALKGTDIPGFKVVEGRSNRIIVDPDALAKVLIELGYSAQEIYELKNITTLEKLLGKKKFAEISQEYVTKPEGKPTLAKVSDKRQEIVETEFEFKEEM
ncbi:MAG TPA: DUF2800 domain-containing protein [Defluviitoga sp.]|nr:DUF2800 domain-containing protein [Defluviitoga sp.]